MEQIILSIDCGTQSLRALLFSSQGTLIDKEQVIYDEPYTSPNPGWAEQDAQVYWQSLCDACQNLRKRNPELFLNIKGVGVTTQRATMVNLDKGGNPLRPVITWLDQRKANPFFLATGPVKTVLKFAGLDETFEKGQTDGKCNWIMQNQPDIWDKTYKYVQVSGFLNFRLTGEFTDSIASQIGHIPFNYKKMEWGEKWALTSILFPVDKEKLPRIIPPGDLIGKISETASKLTGIAEGVKVIACGSDKGCETIGMGVVDSSMASLSFGTTATVQITSKKYFEPVRFMPPYPAPIPGHYTPEIEIFRGFWMITWFKNEFAHKDMLEAEKKNIPVEVELDNLLTEAPAGSMGLMVQPFWSPGLEHPDAKGAMIGFGDVHKRAHVYRAVIEGLNYALLEGLHNMEKAGKFKVSKIAVSGGASQSDEICKISADIFNLPLVRGKTFETSGLGAAIITAVGLGIHSSFEDAIDKMVQYDTVFEPNTENTALYKKLYENVYKKMYSSLKPLYKEIRDITGYPER